MIKRIAAIFLIVTATAIFLADFFIPHHHHGTSICFDSSHCSSDHHSDGLPTSSSSNHQHDSEDDCGSCKLKQALMIPTIYQYNELISNTLFTTVILDNQVSTYINTKLLAETVSISVFRYGDSPLLFKPSNEGCIFGLRAPPLA